MTLTETILDDPTLVSALGLLLLGLVYYLRTVGPRRALLIEAVRTIVFRLLDPIATRYGRPLVRDKTEDQDEFIATVDISELELARVFWQFDYRYNPISTKKYRVKERRQWSVLSAAYRDSIGDGEQHHVYVFRDPDGTLDIYGHREASVTNPDAHDGGDELVSGDPAGRVTTALDDAGIDYQV